MAEIKFENIKKDYESKNLFDGLNLTVEDGEFVCLLGPTGSGKSAILRLIAGLDEITEGSLLIDGDISNDKMPKDRNVAMIFANQQLLPSSVYENIAFGLKLRKIGAEEINIKIREIARILDIENVLQRKTKNLNAHERQRVTIARALVREPSVCLFDDSLASLNDDLTRIMRSELVKIQYRLGTTFIFATRDQIDAMTMATKIVMLNDGIIEQVGSPKEIYLKPQTVFVAKYIGSPEINLATGKVNFENENGIVEFSNIKVNISKDSFIDGVENGQNVTVAIRPENLKIAGEEADFNAKVKAVEVDGEYKVITIDIGEKTLNEWNIIAPKEMEISVGENIGVKIDDGKVLVFNQETEQTILK